MHIVTLTPSPEGEVIIARSIWQTIGADPETKFEVRIFNDHIEIHPKGDSAALRSTDEAVHETEQDVGC